MDALAYRPTPKLIYQLFIKSHKNPHFQVLAHSVSVSGN